MLLDESLGKILFGPVNNEVDATKVIAGLDNIVHIDTLHRNAYRIRLKDIARLVMRKKTKNRNVD